MLEEVEDVVLLLAVQVAAIIRLTQVLDVNAVGCAANGPTSVTVAAQVCMRTRSGQRVPTAREIELLLLLRS